RQARAGERADRRERRLPAQRQSGVVAGSQHRRRPAGLVEPAEASPPGRCDVKREAARGGGGRPPNGPLRTGTGTCLDGAYWMVQAAGGADDAASPGPMCRWTAAGGTTALPTAGLNTSGDRPSNRTDVHLRTFSRCEGDAPQDVVLGGGAPVEPE